MEQAVWCVEFRREWAHGRWVPTSAPGPEGFLLIRRAPFPVGPVVSLYLGRTPVIGALEA